MPAQRVAGGGCNLEGFSRGVYFIHLRFLSHLSDSLSPWEGFLLLHTHAEVGHVPSGRIYRSGVSASHRDELLMGVGDESLACGLGGGTSLRGAPRL